MFDSRERKLEGLGTGSSESVSLRDFYQFKKEFQEFKAVAEEREKLRERLWRERLAFIAALITSWGVTITTLLRLFRVL